MYSYYVESSSPGHVGECEFSEFLQSDFDASFLLPVGTVLPSDGVLPERVVSKLVQA